MQIKMKIKAGIDLLMTVLLLLLMAYQITGQELHEWVGVGMLVLFLIHNILNIRWYGSLFKGKYRLMRVIQTAVNFGVLITMLCLGFSGIVMSRHVFAALSIHGPMATARMMHLAASYLGFVLMSAHLGFHWGMVMGMCRKLAGGGEKPQAILWILRAVAALIAVYGMYLFGRKNIVSYIFLRQQFVFFDFEQGAAAVFTEYIAMMGFWVFTAYYISKGIGRISVARKSVQRNEKKGDGNYSAFGFIVTESAHLKSPTAMGQILSWLYSDVLTVFAASAKTCLNCYRRRTMKGMGALQYARQRRGMASDKWDFCVSGCYGEARLCCGHCNSRCPFHVDQVAGMQEISDYFSC